EIGLMVTHADENGFLSFLRVGGWRADVLVGQRLELLTSKGSLSGVVGRKASRPLRRGEEFPRVELEDLHLDIGARSREEALELVAIGDVAVIAGEPVELERSEEHTSELQSLRHLVCRLLLEKKKIIKNNK